MCICQMYSIMCKIHFWHHLNYLLHEIVKKARSCNAFGQCTVTGKNDESSYSTMRCNDEQWIELVFDSSSMLIYRYRCICIMKMFQIEFADSFGPSFLAFWNWLYIEFYSKDISYNLLKLVFFQYHLPHKNQNCANKKRQ